MWCFIELSLLLCTCAQLRQPLTGWNNPKIFTVLCLYCFSIDLPCMDFITVFGFSGNCTLNEFRYLPSTQLEIIIHCKPWVKLIPPAWLLECGLKFGLVYVTYLRMWVELWCTHTLTPEWHMYKHMVPFGKCLPHVIKNWVLLVQIHKRYTCF